MHRYRPRVEGLVRPHRALGQRGRPGDSSGERSPRTTSPAWYGKTAESRIADPADPARVFSWLICESYDDKGNVISYEYKAEDSTAWISPRPTSATEPTQLASANRYIKRVCYGNRTPVLPRSDRGAASAPARPTGASSWCSTTAITTCKRPRPARMTGIPWTCRLDPFSTYRATFEVRTYRLCRRVLMFHNFPDDRASAPDCLVRSTDLTHSPATPAAEPQPALLFVPALGHAERLHAAWSGGYLSNSLPPLEFAYTQAMIDETVRDVGPDSLMNLPAASTARIPLGGPGRRRALPASSPSRRRAGTTKPISARQTSSSSPATLHSAAFRPVEAGRQVAVNRGLQRPADSYEPFRRRPL